MTGSVPSDLCSPDGLSPLTDIFLDSSQLSGALDVSSCLNLILLDGSFNNISGTLNTPHAFNQLHTVKLNNNSLLLADTLDGLIKGKQATEISIPCNRESYLNATFIIFYRRFGMPGSCKCASMWHPHFRRFC